MIYSYIYPQVVREQHWVKIYCTINQKIIKKNYFTEYNLMLFKHIDILISK